MCGPFLVKWYQNFTHKHLLIRNLKGLSPQISLRSLYTQKLSASSLCFFSPSLLGEATCQSSLKSYSQSTLDIYQLPLHSTRACGSACTWGSGDPRGPRRGSRRGRGSPGGRTEGSDRHCGDGGDGCCGGEDCGGERGGREGCDDCVITNDGPTAVGHSGRRPTSAPGSPSSTPSGAVPARSSSCAPEKEFGAFQRPKPPLKLNSTDLALQHIRRRASANR